ncbi:hypothetical protein [Paraburkholderia tropica]|uniref:hypothetical protein n=1 Tax=Paraburkholderia tropica TaxID=92647 RepID=UPI002AB0E5A3|nr:hypothetical protein [Paraburkholderia tropica]
MDQKQLWTFLLAGDLMVVIGDLSFQAALRDWNGVTRTIMTATPLIAACYCVGRLAHIDGQEKGRESGLREAGKFADDVIRLESELRAVRSQAASTIIKASMALAGEADELADEPRGENRAANAKTSTGSALGRNMQLAMTVQEIYWNPDRCDLTDSDTWPSQKDVIEFIKTRVPGISQAEAASIERTACPVKR